MTYRINSFVNLCFDWNVAGEVTENVVQTVEDISNVELFAIKIIHIILTKINLYV